MRGQHVAAAVVETDIPARLDRLPWGRFHNLLIVALGVTWILDGLEVTLAGALAGALKASPTMQFSNIDLGLAGSAYLIGAVGGALFFGWLTDRLGRKKLFFITLFVYLIATAATAFSWDIWSFCFFRMLTGAGIEEQFRRQKLIIPNEPLPRIRIAARTHTPLAEVARTLFRDQRQRSLVGLSLMASQAFFYNAIFFTYALVLTDFYGIRADQVGWYLLPFAAGNFLGPVFLGRLFDTVGRRIMIAFTYGISGVLLTGAGYLFAIGILTATQQTIAWMTIFFFASAAASSAYLTVSETFPLEVRALAIAFFYAIGTGIGGIAGPWLFGILIDTGSRWSVYGGYLLGAALMIAAAFVAARYAVAAERKPLEAVCRPLAVVD